MKECPSCGSPSPHLHPAVQFEGEVGICINAFHLTNTPENTDRCKNMVREKQAEKAKTALS